MTPLPISPGTEPNVVPDGNSPSVLRSIFFGTDGLRAGWSLLLYVVLVGVLLALIQAFEGHLHGAHKSDGQSQHVIMLRHALLNEWLDAGAVALATLAMAATERRRFSQYGLASGRSFGRFAAGLLWGVLLLSLLVFALWAEHLLVFDGRLLSGASALRYAALWLLMFLGVGLFEETFFRGYLLFTLWRGLAGVYRAFGARSANVLGFWTAALVLSFGFGFVHKTNAGESPIGLFAAGVASLVFCFSLWRTGSLWWAIGFHATWDWAESYLYGVADSGNMAEGHLYATHPNGSPVLSGGVTGPEGSIWVLPVLLLAAGVILLTLRKHAPDATSIAQAAQT